MPMADRTDSAAESGRPAKALGTLPGAAAAEIDEAIDRQAVDEVVVLCFARLRKLASRMLSRYTASRRQEDTDDLLQNAALRLRRTLAAVPVESAAHAMALAVTQLKWELGDLIRRLRRRPDEAATGAGLEHNAAAEDHLEAWSAFHEAVEQLPKPQRDAVHCLWYLGLDQERAAAILGVTSRTVRRHWRMAREALRDRFDDLDFGG